MPRDTVTLEDLRQRMNDLDRQLIALVAERKAVSEEVARASIDWLHSTTCRLLALMGGEVVLRYSVSAAHMAEDIDAALAIVADAARRTSP